MTQVSDIIARAYRETNLIPRGATPTATEIAEAVPLLNSLILSTMGFEAGEGLTDLIIGGDFDQSDLLIDYVPDNIRLVLNIDTPTIVGLDPYPYEGQRIAIVDVTNNLSTNTITLEGNGRKIEGGISITVDVDGTDVQWMYRGDSGDWVRVAALTQADPMPFPTDFDDYFIVMLALRINPRHGATLSTESQQMLIRNKVRIRNRYRNTKVRMLPDPGILSPEEQARFWNSSTAFDLGTTYFPWYNTP